MCLSAPGWTAGIDRVPDCFRRYVSDCRHRKLRVLCPGPGQGGAGSARRDRPVLACGVINGLAAITFMIGYVLFGVAMTKTASLPRWSGVCVAVGAPAHLLGLGISVLVSTAAWPVAILGSVSLGARPGGGPATGCGEHRPPRIRFLSTREREREHKHPRVVALRVETPKGPTGVLFGKCISLGHRAAVVQLASKDDTAHRFYIGGRLAAKIKKLSYKGPRQGPYGRGMQARFVPLVLQGGQAPASDCRPSPDRRRETRGLW